MLGDITSKRRGEIGSLASLPDGRHVVKAKVCLSVLNSQYCTRECLNPSALSPKRKPKPQVSLEELVGYASELRSISGGTASFHMAFSHFAAH